jgi:hypothetical protein
VWTPIADLGGEHITETQLSHVWELPPSDKTFSRIRLVESKTSCSYYNYFVLSGLEVR